MTSYLAPLAGSAVASAWDVYDAQQSFERDINKPWRSRAELEQRLLTQGCQIVLINIIHAIVLGRCFADPREAALLVCLPGATQRLIGKYVLPLYQQTTGAASSPSHKQASWPIARRVVSLAGLVGTAWAAHAAYNASLPLWQKTALYAAYYLLTQAFQQYYPAPQKSSLTIPSVAITSSLSLIGPRYTSSYFWLSYLSRVYSIVIPDLAGQFFPA